ncbi:MAG: hypothetical protein WC662_00840 [Candidatus Paceibacterota bacterium]|jgi:hypothetical protein
MEKKKECEKSPTGKHEWINPEDLDRSVIQFHCKFCSKPKHSQETIDWVRNWNLESEKYNLHNGGGH